MCPGMELNRAPARGWAVEECVACTCIYRALAQGGKPVPASLAHVEGLQAECHPYVHVLAMLELLQCTSYASLSAVCRMGMPGTMRMHGHRALLDDRSHAQRSRAIKVTASALAPAQIPRSINGKR